LSLKVCFQTFKDKKPFKDSKIMANKPKTYVGINNEINGGMTSIGKVIRDGVNNSPYNHTCPIQY
jgi:phage baseplate assembly protein gpV